MKDKNMKIMIVEDNEPMREVPPLVVKKGMLAQLKAMMLGRRGTGY